MLKSFLLLAASVFLFILFTFFYGKLIHTKEKSLQEIFHKKGITKIENPKIVIETKNNALLLYDKNVLIKKYRIDLGHYDFELARNKNHKNYVSTPKGVFSVCSKTDDEKFYKKIKLNYPDTLVVKKAEFLRLLSENEVENIMENLKYGCNFKFDKTIFGPELFIHGFGKAEFILSNLPFVFNWTDGSIALSNKDLDELETYLKIGMKVRIK